MQTTDEFKNNKLPNNRAKTIQKSQNSHKEFLYLNLNLNDSTKFKIEK